MKHLLVLYLAACAYMTCSATDTIMVKLAVQNGRLSEEWKQALITRMPASRIDSLGAIGRDPDAAEKAWLTLITAKAKQWNRFRDSLLTPFSSLAISDTVCILAGMHGIDDGFTYQCNTVCLDLTALQRNYGDAVSPVNNDRIDRIFAHEYTHLLHKLWLKKNRISIITFPDEVLWECLYEGLGMYRSLSARWLPVNGRLPDTTQKTLDRLYPVFTRHITMALTIPDLSPAQKTEVQRHLSRGNVPQKWGAFTVAIWLSLEAGNDERRLQQWINKGPEGIIELAHKYLPPAESVKLPLR